MGSKKHKKESKKRKHRSRSRSPLDGEERERKRHKKHKDRKKDRSPDVEEVPVDSHLYKETEVRSGHRSESAERDRRHREHRSRKEEEGRSARGRSSYKDSETDDRRYRDVESSYKDDETRPHKDEDSRSYRDEDSRYTGHDEDSSQREEEHRSQRDDVSSRSVETEDDRETSPVAAASGAHESMSVEQTNRLRAKLGLKPLEVADKPSDDGKFKDDLGEFYHKPAVNITQQKKTDKIREKLEERKEKRKIEQKLKTTLLAEGSDDEDAMAWVMKSRDIEKQKQEAAKRAAMLDEMDAVFGVSALVAEDEQAARQESYTARELRGLRVAHDIDAIGDERETVLTLADREVLAEEDDMLVNVNMVDDERYKKNIDVLKKAKAGYQAYDDEAELEAAALGYQKPVLSKYDEEINKGKPDGSKGFVIGDEDALEAKRFKNMMRQERLQGGGSKRLESLQMPALQIASDYMDHHEIEAKFKKFKRKGKSRKRAKQEPIDVDDYDPSNAPLETDDTEVKPELLQQEEADEDEVLVDSELQTALARARRLRQQEASQLKVEDILERVKEEPGAAGAGAGAGGAGDEAGVMVLDATAEFCRTLGDIPTYGLAGNRDKQAEIMDFEREELEMEVDTGGAGAWSRVDTQHEKPPDLVAAADVGLEAEPALGAGVGGALRLALSKGYLERAGPAPPARAPPALLHAKHYSIEDKAGGEDDKYGRRERGGGGGGPLQDFREKTNFKPNIKLEYVDDDGRPLCQKEAFRYLSHKFHGKGPGKNKQEKRIKKQVQEGLMKKMSSTDTPLGTLQMLQEKQRETHSPFIVLSGAKREPNT